MIAKIVVLGIAISTLFIGISQVLAQPGISFAGGPGDSMETAVVIQGATGSRDGIAAEYAYLEKQFGQRNVDWKLKRQSLRHHQGKHYDLMEIILKDGSPKEILFDITGFFEKF